eukprot:958959-Rhodomonas_salina.8
MVLARVRVAPSRSGTDRKYGATRSRTGTLQRALWVSTETRSGIQLARLAISLTARAVRWYCRLLRSHEYAARARGAGVVRSYAAGSRLML